MHVAVEMVEQKLIAVVPVNPDPVTDIVVPGGPFDGLMLVIEGVAR